MYYPQWVSSYDYIKYISFPSKETTFDYALISSLFALKKVVCKEEEVSDHRMLVVEISKN